MKKILLIQTAFIGDVVLATALLEKLHMHFPDASLHLLVRKGNESLLKGHPFLEEVLVWDKKKGKYRDLFRLLRLIRSRRYDLAVNLQRFGATGLLTALSGARQTVGFDKNPFSRFFTRRFPHQIGDLHEIDRNLSLISHLTDAKRVLPRLYPSEQDYLTIRQSAPYVCIAPTSVWFTKQWPAQKWVSLLDRIPDSVSVCLLGGPADVPACQAIAKQAKHPSVSVLAGKLSFLESVALMEGAVLNYVNDSAPLHFASSVQAPVVAIFCSTIPDFGFYPLSEQSWVMETELPLSCRPCGLHGKATCPEGHFRCAEIDPERMLSPLQALLDSTSPKSS